MKISLALGPRGLLSRQTAWGCLTTNLALPGIGSLMAGRRVGYPQAILGFGGLAVSVLFGLPFIYWCLANWSRLYGDQADPVSSMAELWTRVRWASLGIVLFAAGWLWALATSCMILHQSQADSNIPPRLD